MLETICNYINNKSFVDFEELFVDYVLSIQNQSVLLEIEYLRKHNKLDVLKLDKLINKELEEATVKC